MRWPWRRSRRELAPREAYDLWSEHYGEPPNALQELEQEHLLEMLPPVEDRRVLDVGCGRGRVLRLLQEQRPAALLGLDLSLGMLARWLAPGVPRIGADLDRLPLRGASFDVAVAALVLAHLRSLEEALPPLLDLIRPGGRLILSDFHPAAADRGWQRTFNLPDSREQRAVRHHRHSVEDYRRPFRDRGWLLEQEREPRWEGVPVLLLMCWRRPADEGRE